MNWFSEASGILIIVSSWSTRNIGRSRLHKKQISLPFYWLLFFVLPVRSILIWSFSKRSSLLNYCYWDVNLWWSNYISILLKDVSLLSTCFIWLCLASEISPSIISNSLYCYCTPPLLLLPAAYLPTLPIASLRPPFSTFINLASICALIICIKELFSLCQLLFCAAIAAKLLPSLF